MKTNSVVLLGGVIAFGVSLMWGQAFSAYGAQWRPAYAAPAMPRHVGQPRVANIPTFRPRTTFAARPNPYSERSSRAQPRFVRPRAALTPTHQLDRQFPHYPNRMPNPRTAYAAFPPALNGVSWSRPAWPMGSGFPGLRSYPPAWPPHYGAVSPQFAYPNRAPVAAVPYWSRPPVNHGRWPGDRAPTAALMRPTYPNGATAPAGVWRPVPGTRPMTPMVGHRGFVAPGLTHRVSPGQPVWREVPSRVSAASPRTVPAYRWRPSRAMASSHVRYARPFRPVERPAVVGRFSGPPLEPRIDSGAASLPGWATVRGEPKAAAVCGWCNGS